jgi:AcrR family transcriptional regulator
MARPRTVSDEAILAATARAIARHGPANLTLARVAEAAGLSPATLVQRFGSKRGLLLALSAAAVEGVSGDFAAARRAHDAPLAALYAAMSGMAGSVADRTELANSVAFLHMDIADQEFRGHAADHARAVRDEIAVLLRAAVAAGELDPSTDTERLARAVQVTYNGSLIVWALTGDGDLPDFVADDLTTLLRPYRPNTDDAPGAPPAWGGGQPV